MGKKPGRPSRHTRRKQQRLDRGFMLTVGAAPTSRSASGAVALHNELRFVRSSLLYADRVDLIAPAASLLWTFAPLRGLDPDNVWERSDSNSATIVKTLNSKRPVGLSGS